MGYYTVYNLAFLDPISYELLPPIRASALFHRLAAEHPLNDLDFESNDDGTKTISAKWYDHEPELLDATRAVQDPLVRLHGVGEEHSDEWVKYFYRGRLVKSARREPWTLPLPTLADFPTPPQPISTALTRQQLIDDWMFRTPHAASCPYVASPLQDCTCVLYASALDADIKALEALIQKLQAPTRNRNPTATKKVGIDL